jgi:RHS repeat-associated protein
MGTTTFVWDPVFDCVTHELDENNAVKAVYNNEPQQYGGVLSQRRGTTTSTYHADALGSTRFLTDSSGNVTDTYLNDAWGNSVASTGTTVNPFKWVGKYGYYTDDSTGQLYVRARMYQPTLARWRSVDPAGYVEDLNAFQYSQSNPVLTIDASGQCSCCCCCPEDISLTGLDPSFVPANSGDPTGFPKPAPHDRMQFSFTVITALRIVEERVEPGETCKAEWYECSSRAANLGQKPFTWSKQDPRPGIKHDWDALPPSSCPATFRREWSDAPTLDIGNGNLLGINFLFRVKATPGCTSCTDKMFKFHVIAGIKRANILDPAKPEFDPKPSLAPGWQKDLDGAGCNQVEFEKLFPIGL